MIDGSEKRNRQLAFELQNSHVCEKRSNSQSILPLRWAVDKTRNMEHPGTFRNIPEHEKIKIFFYEKMIN